MPHPAVKALIPMKGHSERVPGKNIRPLCGKPLFFWVVEALGRSRYISEIMIDTDSEEIAGLARGHAKVSVLMRPERLHGDFVGINTLIDHQISHTDGEWFLQTHSTNPLLTTETVDRAVEAFFGGEKYDSMYSVTPIQSRFYWEDGRPINHDPANMLRTQDLPPVLEENSNFYIFSRSGFKKYSHRIGGKALPFRMNKLEAIDIDNEEDFILAECLMRQKLKV